MTLPSVVNETLDLPNIRWRCDWVLECPGGQVLGFCSMQVPWWSSAPVVRCRGKPGVSTIFMKPNLRLKSTPVQALFLES